MHSHLLHRIVLFHIKSMLDSYRKKRKSQILNRIYIGFYKCIAFARSQYSCFCGLASNQIFNLNFFFFMNAKFVFGFKMRDFPKKRILSYKINVKFLYQIILLLILY